MRKRTLRHIVGILARYRRHGVWRKIVSVLCCIVVFCTTYALILPAITMERTPTCGKEEHTHTRECYTQVTQNHVCSLERLGVHEHTESCKDEAGNLCCYDATFIVHEHVGSCYDENGNLWCPLPEIKAHTHDDSCYETAPTEVRTELERGELICTESTEVTHTHTEQCYTGQKVLTCQIPEGEGHRHGDSCRNEAGELTCGQEEHEGHTHGDDCYITEPVLTCTLSTVPHQHTDECYEWIEVRLPSPPSQRVLICDKEEIILHTHTMADCYRSDEYGNNYLVCTTLQILEHVHSADCFRTVDPDALTCGLEEGPDHQHSELCYGQWVLVCGKEEHTHTDECREPLPTEYRWSRDGLEITAAFSPGVELPEGAALVVERQTPETPVPLSQMLATFAAQPIADTDPSVGNGLARSSQEADPETDPSVGNGLAHSSQETEPADAQQACLLSAEEEPPQQVMSTCMDYFRVYLAVDGVEVAPQAQADVTIRLQSDKYLDASRVELVQVTDNSVLAQADQTGSLTASFTGAVSGDFAVVALAEAPRATGTNVAASLTPSKTIEALTEANTYRLHLDAVVGASMADSPMNMLLVLDRSGSMTRQMDPNSSDLTSRNDILKEVVNGEDGYYGKKGLIYNFLSKNSGNRLAVVGFAGAAHNTNGLDDASVLKNWTNDRSTTIDLDYPSGATNYCAAFVRADQKLAEIETQNNNPTILVFISDGRPTYYIDENGRGGPSNEEDPDLVTECIEKSKPYFDTYIRNKHPNVTVYTVGMSTDIVGGGKDAILQEMAQKGGGEYFPATSASQLQNAINSISSGKTYTALKIEDKLSAYVDLADQPEYKVTKKTADGAETVLYENGAVTTAGNGIVESVGPSADGRTVTATFVPSYELEPGCTYSLSYNVKVSQTAQNDFHSTGYPHTGDPNTDYDPSKATSSGQPGFHSNEVATMSYKADGKDGSKTYPHPVVQVSGPTAQPELALTPHKTIDALREGADNPDTTLDDGLTEEEKTDLYRLYLDAEISPQTKPIDLLLVVDQSGSMHDNYSGTASQGPDMTDYDGKSIFRNEALNLVLNGANGNDGLIAKFLNANKDNWLAVASFQAGTTDSSHDYGKGEAPFETDANGDPIIDYKGGDASTLLNWTQTPQQVAIEGKYANATNYMAGFQQADKLLNNETIKNNGHNKVMIFLSDGQPTCYIATDGNGSYWRDGDGRTEGGKTGEATDTAFEEFVEQHSDLLIHTVSLKAGTAETRLDGMKSPDVGHCYSVHDTNELRNALSKLMYGTAYTELKIEDTLSTDVELFEQPDYKVTLTTPEGQVTTLYAGGKVTDQGKGILESVTYDSTNRKVIATFNPSYTPAPGNKVTLSFNVVATQSAYDKFKTNGYGDVKGDNGTDYTGNNTSSGQPGFFSNDNDKTQVSYKKYDETEPTTQNYPKPVIQVDANKDQPTVPDTSNLKVTPHKTIDYLGDDGTNGDTNQKGVDSYRLYLDAQVGPPVGMPMDLLIVVDQSSSMNDDLNGGVSRKQALLNVLNGTGGKEGLISKFIKMDEGNHIAVLGFAGEYLTDRTATDLRRGWGRDASAITLGSGTYTNYTKALEEADKLLDEARSDRPNNPKVMVFLSDGGPTIYYDAYGNRYVNTWGEVDNNSRTETIRYFDDTFWPNNQDVKINTVTIGFDSVVLPHMANKGNGQNFTANTVDALANALETARIGNAYINVQIQDTLSAYVDVHPTQPDYKVTMKDAAGNETVLWQGNAATAAGNGIIKSVSTSGKTVTATFNPNYVLEPNCTYTLSYNVQVTQTAYDEYKKSTYPHTGQAGTDYPGNATSSNQPGFHSNAEAKLIYKKDGVDDSKTYPHPVVQVTPSALTVQKKWFSKEGTDITATQSKVSEVQFQLIKIATPQAAPEPQTATINVTSLYKRDSRWDPWQTDRTETWTAKVGSEVTIKLQIKRQFNSNFKSATTNIGGTFSGSNPYTCKFTVTGNMDIEILSLFNAYLRENPIDSLTHESSTIPTVDTTPFEVSRETYTLSRQNSWQMSFTDLPKTGTEIIGGKEVPVTYEYDVKELPVTGYTSETIKETGGSRGTVFTIKNTSDTPSRKIIIRKTDSDDATKVLQGAQFELYRKALDGETGVTLGKLDGTYILISPPGVSRPTTDENGLLSFTGLEDGNYWLVETKAPKGYHRNEEPIPFTINPDGSVTCSVDGVTVGVAAGEEPVPMITVPNKPWGHKLPQTGGTGREPYTIGGLLIISFAILLLYNKKRGKEDAISS